MEKSAHQETPKEESPAVMSKAAQLAMELSKEKKRLNEELTALQAENDALTPATPRDDISWIVKWMSVITGVFGIFLMSSSFVLYGTISYFISAIGWVYVGGLWNDKAIMIGSAVTATAVGLKLLEFFS